MILEQKLLYTLSLNTKTMECKNYKRNRRRVVYYHINKFDYEVKENLYR